MPIHSESGHPDWYIESLAAKYQYLADEHAGQSANRLVSFNIAAFCALVGILANLALGNFWAVLLSILLVLFARNLELQNRRFQIASQMLLIESEFPYVRENIALPKKEPK